MVSAIVLAMLPIDALFAGGVHRLQPWAIDFLPLWTAVRTVWQGGKHYYDFAAITGQQAWLLGPVHKVRPWIYPPSALLLLAPLGLLGFWASATLWIISNMGTTIWAGLKTAAPATTLSLTLVLPASLFVAVTGQISFLISGLSLLAITWLERRPILAGVLVGSAAALKPSSLVLLPIGLLGARAFRSLGTATATVAALAAASAAAFGPRIWLDWLTALPRFQKLVMQDPAMVRGMITPTSMAIAGGVHGQSLIALQLVLVLFAVAVAWSAFQGSRDPIVRMTALLGGGLVVSPYAMQYDIALLAIPAAALVARGRSWPEYAAAICGYLLLSLGVFPYIGGMVTMGYLLYAGTWMLFDAWRQKRPSTAMPVAQMTGRP